MPAFSQPVHLIQFEMIVNPNNKKYVHHLLVYECQYGFDYGRPLAKECGNTALPNIVASSCMGRMIVAWGVGGEYVRTTTITISF